MKLFVPFLLAGLFVHSALAADIKPARTKVNNICTSYRLCDAELGTGVCQDSSNTDEIVLHVGQAADYILYSNLSTATNYSCDIFTSSDGTPGSGTITQVNTASITDEAPAYTMFVPLRYLWINCSTIDGGLVVTIDALVCPRR